MCAYKIMCWKLTLWRDHRVDWEPNKSHTPQKVSLLFFLVQNVTRSCITIYWNLSTHHLRCRLTVNDKTHLWNCTCGTPPTEREAYSTAVQPVLVTGVCDQTVVPAGSSASTIQWVMATFSDPAGEMECSLEFCAWGMVALAAGGWVGQLS